MRSDSVIINGQAYRLADAKVKRSLVRPQVQIIKDAGEPDFSDLGPELFGYEMRDFSRGIGLYTDHGKKFSGQVWRSELEHFRLGGVTLPPLATTVVSGTRQTDNFVYFNGITYALTENGLYEFNSAHTSLTAVAGTPNVAFTTAQVHRGILYLSGPAISVRSFDTAGTFAVLANQPGAGAGCTHLLEQDNRLFAVEIYVGAVAGIRVWLTTDGGATAWTTAITTPAGGTGVISSPAIINAVGACVAPISNVSSRIYVSTTAQVWEVDYTTGAFRPIFDMSDSDWLGNGQVLLYWGAIGKLVVNQKNTIVLINLETREASPVGPEYSQLVAGYPDGLPSNTFVANASRDYDFKAEYINCATVDGNYLYIGTLFHTTPTTSKGCLVMSLSVEGKWAYRARLTECTLVSALHIASTSTGPMLLVSARRVPVPTDTDTITSYRLDGTAFNVLAVPNDVTGNRLELPWITCGLPMTNKVAFSMLVDLFGITATTNLRIDYALNYDEATTPTTLGTITSATSLPYQLDFVSQDGQPFRSIKFFVYMWDTNATATLSPVFLGMTMMWRPAPPARYISEMLLLVDSRLDREGMFTDLDNAIRSAVEGNTTLSFDPRGDPAATMERCVPIVFEDVEMGEGYQDTAAMKLVLVEVY